MWAYRVVRPGHLKLEAAPDLHGSNLADGEVLLRLLAGGICGSDVPKFLGTRGVEVGTVFPAAGLPLGMPLHEVVGEVVASSSPFLEVGERVVGWARDSNALAEFVRTAGDRVVRYPEDMAPTDAVLAQPLACVLEAVARLPLAGARVAVLGLGAMGALFALVARSAGAAHVTGIDIVDRSALDPRLGVDEFVHASGREWAGGLRTTERPDIVIEVVGHQTETVDDAVVAVAAGGTVLCFGIPDQRRYAIDLEALMRKNLSLLGGVTAEHRRGLRHAVDFLSARPWLASALVTDVHDRDQVQQAYEAAASARPDRLKVVLTLA